MQYTANVQRVGLDDEIFAERFIKHICSWTFAAASPTYRHLRTYVCMYTYVRMYVLLGKLEFHDLVWNHKIHESLAQLKFTPTYMIYESNSDINFSQL